MRILVADDHPVNLKLLSDILESEGYTVDRARDGKEALELVQKVKPSLMLLDIAMPGLDGLALTRQLKESDATRDIKIFIVTASAMKGDADRALAAGCDDYISKPIDVRQLLGKVDDIRLELTGKAGTPSNDHT
jgi:CheY-like chemotaxis protein